MKYLVLFLLVSLYFFPTDTYAVTTTMEIRTSPPLSSEPFIIHVQIEGASAGTNYLRVDLYKQQDNTHYFGETHNGQEWYGGSESSQYFPALITKDTVWESDIQARVGAPSTDEYPSDGEYMLRVRRYTPSGSYNSDEARSSAIPVQISLQSSSPTHTQEISPSSQPSPAPTPPPTATASPTPISPQPTTQAYTDKVYLSEVMVNPENGEKEWVELYNDHDYTVTLSHWLIDDKENEGTNPQSISLTIDAKNYGVVEFASSLFNNDADTVRLLDGEGHLRESFSYQATQKGLTFGKVLPTSSSFCLQSSTYKKANASCISPSATPTISPTPILTPTHTPAPTTTRETTPHSSPTSSVKKEYPLFQLVASPEGSVLSVKDEATDDHSLVRIARLRGISYVTLSISLISSLVVGARLIQKILTTIVYTA